MTRSFLALVCGMFLLAGCAHVDVTKTAKGFVAPTNPNDVEILMTRPERRYTELGTVTATGYAGTDTAKMHNGLRAKAAPLGANAVIITSSGHIPAGWGQTTQWANGVAIRWN